MRDLDPNTFAREWISAWNRRDLPSILAHYAADVRFVSPTAARVTGNAVVVGKAALEQYWTRALASIDDLKFTLEHPIWDADRRLLAIVYARRAGR
ncbi:MAG: nuclear transport factor 2 family protein, partial [Tepidiformaceae bacterium]